MVLNNLTLPENSSKLRFADQSISHRVSSSEARICALWHRVLFNGCDNPTRFAGFVKIVFTPSNRLTTHIDPRGLPQRPSSSFPVANSAMVQPVTQILAAPTTSIFCPSPPLEMTLTPSYRLIRYHIVLRLCDATLFARCRLRQCSIPATAGPEPIRHSALE